MPSNALISTLSKLDFSPDPNRPGFLLDPGKFGLRDALFKFLQTQYAEENLEFLIKLQALNFENPLAQEKLNTFFDKFIPTNGATPINISSAIQARLMDVRNNLTLDSFNEAAAAIIKLIVDDKLGGGITLLLNDKDIISALDKFHRENSNAPIREEVAIALQANRKNKIISDCKASVEALNEYLQNEIKLPDATIKFNFNVLTRKQPYETAEAKVKSVISEINELIKNSASASNKDLKKNFQSLLVKNIILLEDISKDMVSKLGKLEESVIAGNKTAKNESVVLSMHANKISQLTDKLFNANPELKNLVQQERENKKGSFASTQTSISQVEDKENSENDSPRSRTFR